MASDRLPLEAAGEIAKLLHQINRGLRRRMEERDTSGRTIPQLMTMNTVFHHPGLSLTELSRSLGLSSSTVCGIVDRLEREGLMTRLPDETDRRTLHLALTAPAKEQCEKWASAYRETMAGILGELTPEELANIKSSLAVLARVLSREDQTR